MKKIQIKWQFYRASVQMKPVPQRQSYKYVSDLEWKIQRLEEEQAELESPSHLAQVTRLLNRDKPLVFMGEPPRSPIDTTASFKARETAQINRELDFLRMELEIEKIWIAGYPFCELTEEELPRLSPPPAYMMHWPEHFFPRKCEDGTSKEASSSSSLDDPFPIYSKEELENPSPPASFTAIWMQRYLRQKEKRKQIIKPSTATQEEKPAATVTSDYGSCEDPWSTSVQNKSPSQESAGTGEVTIRPHSLPEIRAQTGNVPRGDCPVVHVVLNAIKENQLSPEKTAEIRKIFAGAETNCYCQLCLKVSQALSEPERHHRPKRSLTVPQFWSDGSNCDILDTDIVDMDDDDLSVFQFGSDGSNCASPDIDLVDMDEDLSQSSVHSTDTNSNY